MKCLPRLFFLFTTLPVLFTACTSPPTTRSSNEVHLPRKDLRVSHFHQVFGVKDWTEGRTFKSPVTGEERSILYAACWPTVIVELLVYWQVIENDPDKIAEAIKKAYNSFADFDDGTHTDLIPSYIAQNYPKLYAQKVEVMNLKQWPSKKKWLIVKGCIDKGWPIAAGINWVRSRDRIFPHAFIIRGYRLEANGTKKAIVNDVAGSYTMAGRWDKEVSGEAMIYDYEDFFDRSFLIIVPYRQRQKLIDFIANFSP